MNDLPAVAPRSALAAPTRRIMLAGGAAAAGAVALPAPAEAAVRPRAYRGTPIPSRRDLHLMQRFSYGYSTQLRNQVAAAGGGRRWLNVQLRPGTVPDGFAAGLRDWFPLLEHDPYTAYQNVQSGRISRSDYIQDISRWSLLRQIYSHRQLHEVMTEFWLNHFHVYSRSNQAWMFRPGYDATIRRHALGSFEALLKAAVTHPAMLRYLDADRSVAGDLNENLGRELLELHTVGLASGYTEAHVLASATILTGQRISSDLRPYYDDRSHQEGPVTVLGFSHANGRGQGQQVLDAYLTYLARHPATARRVAHKLAVRFVGDNPPTALVDRVAAAYRSSGTSIPATLRALVDDDAFHRAATPKVRTPIEDVAASARAIGLKVRRPSSRTDKDAAANALLWLATTIGQQPWNWVTPDGFPDRSDAWASASRMLASFRVHHNLAGGYYPSRAADFRLGAEWLPQRRIRFDLLVDHLCRTVHGRPSTTAILAAACGYLDLSPGTVVSAADRVTRHTMAALVGLLLDSPAHMTR